MKYIDFGTRSVNFASMDDAQRSLVRMVAHQADALSDANDRLRERAEKQPLVLKPFSEVWIGFPGAIAQKWVVDSVEVVTDFSRANDVATVRLKRYAERRHGERRTQNRRKGGSLERRAS